MHIGLIGGIGPAATDVYYRTLISRFADMNVPLELTMVHADTKTLLANQASDNVDAQVEIYNRLTDRLAAAGATCVVVTSIAGHFCIEAFKATTKLLVIDLLEVVDRFVSEKGYDRIGVIGTQVVMETRFYGALKHATVIPPSGELLSEVHASYVDMAALGSASNTHRNVFKRACDELFAVEKVDAILMGGTDLSLVYQPDTTDFPIIDCIDAHVSELCTLAKKDS